MSYKAVLLYKDIPINEWPVGASGEFIFKIVDLSASNQVPDKRPWRLWTPEQANQYSSELENDFDRFDETFGKLSEEREKVLDLKKLEKFGEDAFRKLKIKAKAKLIKASDLTKVIKDFQDFRLFLESGFIESALSEMAKINTTDFTEEEILEIGNPIRAIIGLESVDAQIDLDEGIL